MQKQKLIGHTTPLMKRPLTISYQLPDNNCFMKRKKNVQFNLTVKVVLIPDRIEYAEHDLFDDLWWCNSDYRNFKFEFMQIVQEYMLQIACHDYKTAQKLYLRGNTHICICLDGNML